MLKAVAKAELDSHKGDGSGASEPEKLVINIPNYGSHQEFLDDLRDRL